MKKFKHIAIFLAVLAAVTIATGLARGKADMPASPAIIQLDPPEQGFFTKELICKGIPIKAPSVVSDEAIYEAYRRMSRQLEHLPMVASNLVASRVEVHIIGQHQVTSDLPEYRSLKGKPLPEYNGETIDQRTRGLGGRLTSVAEENLLKLKWDHYYGRDILTHEFGHAIRNCGVPLSVVQIFNEQYRSSLAAGHWKGAYSASNADEFFAELSMWYFGTHGDMGMTAPKPANGPEGFKQYDPQAYHLFDDFYNGRIPIGRVEPGGHEWTDGSDTTNKPSFFDNGTL